MSQYKGSINGKEVILEVNLQVVSSIVNKEAQHKVQISNFNIDGSQSFVPFSTATLPEMTTIMSLPGAPGSLAAKQKLWRQGQALHQMPQRSQ